MSSQVQGPILTALHSNTIAVVGLSKDQTKPSYEVAAYLKSCGYRIVPINPTANEILGEMCYKSLLEVPENLKRQVEVVDIFRRAEDVPPIVGEAIEIHKRYGKPTSVWMQLGIVNEESARKAREAGLQVVMDRCMMVEHKRRLSQTSQ